MFRVSVVTQCACWFRVNNCFPCSASQTFTVRSLLAVYRTPFGPPLPPHRTTLTLAEWPPSVNNVLRVEVDQTRTVPSFEEEARRGFVGFLEKGSERVREGIRKIRDLHVYWFPSKRGNPLGVSFQRVSDWFASPRIP